MLRLPDEPPSSISPMSVSGGVRASSTPSTPSPSRPGSGGQRESRRLQLGGSADGGSRAGSRSLSQASSPSNADAPRRSPLPQASPAGDAPSALATSAAIAAAAASPGQAPLEIRTDSPSSSSPSSPANDQAAQDEPEKASEKASLGLTLPPGACGHTGSPKSPNSLRERLNKKLSVATGNSDTAVRSQVFRLLKDGETIQDHYDLAEEIYSGGAKGKVLVANRKDDGSEVIIKIRTKRSNKGGERTWKAIMAQMHQMRGSQHVLDITEILEDALAFYVVMPKCNGGELFEFLVTETEVPESECKRIIREILTAVGHLHKVGLVHRDVKPENILFDLDRNCAKTPKTVKLIDFDTCVEWTPTSPKSNRFVGTPGYIAPEALLGEITPQSDLWSIGVILFILMTGETPWTSIVSLEDGMVGSPGARKMYNALKKEVVEWDRDPWPDFPLARELCQLLIAFNTEERACTVQEVLNHPWLNEA